MRSEEIAGEALLGGIGMDDRHAADRLVRRDDVDHTPDAELGECNAGDSGERRLEIERIAETTTGFGEEGESRPTWMFGASQCGRGSWRKGVFEQMARHESEEEVGSATRSVIAANRREAFGGRRGDRP
jgi:hypothetical protein